MNTGLENICTVSPVSSAHVGVEIKMSKTEKEYSVYNTENHRLEPSDRNASFVS